MYKKILWGIGIFIAALIIFQAGMFVGFRRASFSYGLGDNYYRTFGGPRGGMMRGFLPDDFPESHGVAGKIIKISLPNIFIAGNDGVEKNILISSSTLIREFRQMASPADLKVDDFVVVIGSPNAQSQIDAKFIRVMPGISTSTQPTQ
jgi:hypothetical protein